MVLSKRMVSGYIYTKEWNKGEKHHSYYPDEPPLSDFLL
jgi:hypothetical protein